MKRDQTLGQPSHEQPTEHDQLFKELLTTFFVEFIELFFPKLAVHLDPEVGVVPMQQEIFNDVKSRERHVVDLLMRGKFKGQDAYFLVHVENQATAQSDFPRRMFEPTPALPPHSLGLASGGRRHSPKP